MVVRECSFHPVPSRSGAKNYSRDQHGHLKYEPEAGKFFELPAGGTAVSQLACNKGATKWWATSEGTTDIRQGGYPCPGYPLSQFHVSSFFEVIDTAVLTLA